VGLYFEVSTNFLIVILDRFDERAFAGGLAPEAIDAIVSPGLDLARQLSDPFTDVHVSRHHRNAVHPRCNVDTWDGWFG
jgi:hypothetical protein